jgi:hypothetical protein
MRMGLKQLRDEIREHWEPKADELEPEDQFIKVMGKYLEDASNRFQDLEALYMNMDAKWKDVMTFYGENPKSSRPDDFFGHFSLFVHNWKEATIAEEKMAIKQEQDEKRRLQEEERKERLRLKKERAEEEAARDREDIGAIDTSKFLNISIILLYVY